MGALWVVREEDISSLLDEMDLCGSADIPSLNRIYTVHAMHNVLIMHFIFPPISTFPRQLVAFFPTLITFSPDPF